MNESEGGLSESRMAIFDFNQVLRSCKQEACV
jgi:hypothetical protein